MLNQGHKVDETGRFKSVCFQIKLKSHRILHILPIKLWELTNETEEWRGFAKV
jgi:hypothetical protein